MKTYTEEQVDAIFDEIESRINEEQDQVTIIDNLYNVGDELEDDDIDIENVIYVDCCYKNLKEIRRDRDFIIKRRLG